MKVIHGLNYIVSICYLCDVSHRWQQVRWCNVLLNPWGSARPAGEKDPTISVRVAEIKSKYFYVIVDAPMSNIWNPWQWIGTGIKVLNTAYVPLFNSSVPDKMATISQTAFANTFSWMKLHEFRLRFHWTLLLRFDCTIFQHWFW